MVCRSSTFVPTNLVELKKIRVGAVSYRNAKPLVYGMEQFSMADSITLTYDYPARLVDQLRSGAIDLGLIPVASIPGIPGARIVGSYGIAADGKVGSVALFSQCPIEEVEEVVLDYQSRTSVALARLLIRDHWKRPVTFLPSSGDEFIDQIKGQRAGLIIGDRALLHAARFSFVYDLAEHWKIHSGLPFVFAAWVATRELPADFLGHFEKANAVGLEQLDKLASEWALPGVDMRVYFIEQIKYRLDDKKREGLKKFLSQL
jgi:chorismate dehydratase